jgi:hypothetical protein
MITETMLWLKANWERVEALRDRPDLAEPEREALERLLEGFEEKTTRIIALQGIVTGLLGETLPKGRARELAVEISEREVAVLRAARGEPIYSERKGKKRLLHAQREG